MVYVTLLVETHGRMLAHLRSLTFFDPAPIGRTLHYLSGSGALQEGGLVGLQTLLREILRTYQPTLLVLEGIEAAHAVATSDLAFKQLLQGMAVVGEARGCTTLLVAPAAPAGDPPGAAGVDGLLELTDTSVGLRRGRTLEVRKFRGSAYLRNPHTCEITDAGLTVYPRTEALVVPAPLPPTPRPRRGFGPPVFDTMLHGGLPSGSATMLLGTPGSGKTLLGLHFLAAGARAGEPGLYFGFDEPPEWLTVKGDALGLDLSAHVAAGRIALHWHPPLDNLLDRLATELLTAVRARGVGRLFIDGLSGLERAEIYPERMFAFFTALMIQLRTLGVTTVFAVENSQLFGTEIQLPPEYASGATDNIIFLRYVELRSQLYRLISILKMRDSAYDSALRAFAFTAQGLEVEATFAGAEAILTGLARPSVAAPAGPPEPEA